MRGSRRRCVGLPQEIEFEIFLNLPLRDLCRLKCVCISRRNTIESDEFKEKHYALQNNSLLLCFNDYINTSHHQNIFRPPNVTTFQNLKTPEPKHLTEVVGPCRGLFLLYKVFSRGYLVDRQALYNPATGAFRLLPKIPYEAKPYRTRYVCGLNWDPFSNDYKVVYYHYHSQVALVYTPSSDSWRFCPKVPDCVLDPVRYADCVLNPIGYTNTNNFCYWLSDSNGRPSIVSFDMAQEVFAALNLPPDITDVGYCESSISTYHDSLAFLAHMWEGDIEVWLLQQQQQHSWTKVFSFRHRTPVYSVVGIQNDTHVLFVTNPMMLKQVKTLVSYDMNNHKTDEVILGFNGMVFLNYKESLFRVRGEASPASSPHFYSFLNKPGTDELKCYQLDCAHLLATS